MTEKKTIRAAIYARVSTGDQNPEPQLEELRQYVRQRGFVLHKEYIDQVTGDFEKRKKKRKQRDLAYQELMEDVSKRLVDCVIVWKYDRFARSLSVLVSALQQFNSLGVDFISYTQQIDTTTPMGRLFYNVIGSFAEFEREMIVERVRAGLANAKAKGVRLGRPEKDKTAPERIIALRQEGWSLRQIADKERLSAAGVLKILKRSNFQPSDNGAKKVRG
jgi:DNA invertase Pin-like site-specific DNA recombinase